MSKSIIDQRREARRKAAAESIAGQTPITPQMVAAAQDIRRMKQSRDLHTDYGNALWARAQALVSRDRPQTEQTQADAQVAQAHGALEHFDAETLQTAIDGYLSGLTAECAKSGTNVADVFELADRAAEARRKQV